MPGLLYVNFSDEIRLDVLSCSCLLRKPLQSAQLHEAFYQPIVDMSNLCYSKHTFTYRIVSIHKANTLNSVDEPYISFYFHANYKKVSRIFI